MAKRKKTFDAVQLSRRLRAKVSRQIAGMTAEQELAFFNRRNGKTSARKFHAKAA